jgi:3-phenylpropionate/cinnamic acid dioxygenase small subunit
VVDDVQAITHLVFAYAELLDRGDIEGLAELFDRCTVHTPGASVSLSGADAIQRLIVDTVHLYDGVPSTKHLVTNLAVEVGDDRTSATARSYYVALQARPELPLQPILAGRWQDRFEGDGTRWWFVERVIHADLVGDLRFHIKMAAAT